MPIDTLKIDRSFVHELETRPESAAIVSAIIAMSRSLKLRVVAKGVETRGQMARLFDQGCHLMQGFLFSPAVPGEDFPALMKAVAGDTHWRMPVSRRILGASGGASGGPADLYVEAGGLAWSAGPMNADHAPADAWTLARPDRSANAARRSRATLIDQAVLDRVVRQLRVVAHPHFLENARAVDTDGFRAQGEGVCDVGEPLAGRDHLQRLELAV